MTQQSSGKLELHPEAQQAINRVKDLVRRAEAAVNRLISDAPACYPDKVSAAMTNTVQWGHGALRPFAHKADEHADNATDGHQAAATGVGDVDDANAANLKPSGDPWNTSGIGSTTK